MQFPIQANTFQYVFILIRCLWYVFFLNTEIDIEDPV